MKTAEKTSWPDLVNSFNRPTHLHKASPHYHWMPMVLILRSDVNVDGWKAVSPCNIQAPLIKLIDIKLFSIEQIFALLLIII